MAAYSFILAGALAATFSTTNNLTLSKEQILYLEARIPGLQQVEKLDKSPNFSLNHIDSPDFSFSDAKNRIIWQEKWRGKLSPDFVHLFYGVARRAWLEKGIFSIHSACVGTDEKGYILLAGRAGSGKTSTALTSARKLNLRIISGDATLIKPTSDQKLKILGGTKVLTIRSKDKFRWPEFENQFDSLGDRLVLKLPANQIGTSSKIMHVKAIVLIQLNDGHNSVKELTPVNAAHTSYPYFMDFERSDVLLDQGNTLFNGDINDTQKKKVVRLLAAAIRQTPAYELSGSMDFVISNLKDIFDQ